MLFRSLPDSHVKEDEYQSKIGLVLKKGGMAFVDEDNQWFRDTKIELNDWIVFRPSDGWSVTINNNICRILDDTAVRGRVRSYAIALMEIDRRRFLAQSGLVAAGALTSGIVAAQSGRRRPQRVAVVGVGHYHAFSPPNYLRILQAENTDIVGVHDPDAAIAAKYEIGRAHV